MTTKLKPKERPHYVSNRDFSEAVYDYVLASNEAKEAAAANDTSEIDPPHPQVTTYIGTCFLKICEGLGHRSNFIHYPFREEMVMDAVENCLKAIRNYDIAKVTRTGKPNAFSYFTQIAWFAFLRRIAKEKRQLDIKSRLIARSGYEEFFEGDTNGNDSGFNDSAATVDRLRSYSNGVQENRTVEKVEQKPKKPPQGLENFIGVDA
jgi:hypothetical protein